MMRWLVGWSLKFRVLVVAVAAGVMFFGVTQLRDASLDVLPEFSPPTVEVQTEALGLSAAEVEQLITAPMEADLLNGVAWLDEIRSESVPGLSSIELIFEPGTDIMRARQVVAERLTQAHALPNVSAPPQMLQPLSTANRVMMVGLSSDKVTPIEMSVLARWTIRPRLLGVAGVANVAMWGQRERQLQVQVDPERLRRKGVSLLQVIETTGNALWVSPLTFLEASTPGTGGFIETSNQRVGLRHVLPITTPHDLSQVTMEEESGALQLGDVATIVESHQPLIGDARNDKDFGLMLVIEKFPGANTLEVTRGVESALDALKPGLSGVKIDSSVFRPATYIEGATGNLGLWLLVGFVLMILALGLLLYEWRAALIGAVVIPLSLIAAGAVLHLRGTSINAMVLVGLGMAMVLVVDDAVAGTDHMLRRLRQKTTDGGKTPTGKAILEATLEVRAATLYATLIVAVAVVPILFMDGLPGALVPSLALSFLLAVTTSMLVALTVTPALAVMLFARAPLERRRAPLQRWLGRDADDPARTMHRTRPALAGVILVVLLGLAALPFLGHTVLPSLRDGDLLIHFDGAAGTSLPEMNRITARASDELRAIPGVRNVGAQVGRAVMSDQVVGANSSELWISIDPAADYESTLASIRKVVDGYPGLDREVLTFWNERVRHVLSTAEDPLVVRLYGQDPKLLRSNATELKQALSEIEGVAGPHVKLDPQEPTVEVRVDLAAAQRSGIKPGDVRRAAATLLSGIQVGSLFEEQKVFDVVVWGTTETRDSLTDVRNLLIDTPDGGHVRLDDVAAVRVRPNATVIRREASQRFLDVAADVQGRDLDAVVADVERRVRAADLPLEYHAEVLTGYAEHRATQTRVLSVAVVAVLGILLLLQAALGSWRLAALISLVLPISLVGGVLAAFVTGRVMTVGSFVGLLAVLGIAARNSIMLVTHYQRLEQEGEAFGPRLVVRGTREQFVPVVATAAVTMLALLPLVIAGGIPGHEVIRPMAVVIVGGLVTSAWLNLLVVPALYLRFGSGREVDASMRELTTSRPEVLTQ
jgi:CzcA family heavy metal efflux pump